MLVDVVLPTLHPGQVKAFWAHKKNKLLAIRAGRRYGKTDLLKTIGCDTALKGYPVGWFAPDYKISAEAFAENAQILDAVLKTSSAVTGTQRLITGGRIDYWTLDNERAGRSRKYKLVVIDEGAFTKANMIEIWERSIKPTLLDYSGSCIVASNTNGVDPENFLWLICNEPKYGFSQFHAPTTDNPHIPQRDYGESDEAFALRRAVELQKLIDENAPLVYQQEFLAEFVDWSGEAFFAKDKLLVDGQPVEYPKRCDYVIAVLDTAVKEGTANDGQGVTYYARSRYAGHKLICLDYDYFQMEGDSMKEFLPSVFARLEELARLCGAREGSRGLWIEDANTGSILLQHGRKEHWPVNAIPEVFKAKGKDGRAIACSTYVYQGFVKFSKYFYDKIVVFKKTSQNHAVSQILGFRVGDKDAHKRADDLLDCFTYGILLTLDEAKGT